MFKQILRSYSGPIQSYAVKDYPHELNWLTDLGIGHIESDGYEYGEEYWETYQKYSADDFGVRLTKARADFVLKNLGTLEDLCDIGVGSGQFVDSVKCKGTDVNPIANEWLKEHGYYVSDVSEFETLTLWDVIEHIEDSRSLLENAQHLFISTPIYKDVNNCLNSKHLKPGEHIWYFTDEGLKYFMKIHGFELKDRDDFETRLGRESIVSYFFKREQG